MDIHFCDSKKGDKICPKKAKCKRYMSSLDDNSWSVNQAFFNEAPFVQKLSGVSCDMFIRLDKYVEDEN